MSWRNNRLEVVTTRSVYFFYIIDLIRILVAILAIIGLIWLINILVKQEPVKVVWKTDNTDITIAYKSKQWWHTSVSGAVQDIKQEDAGNQWNVLAEKQAVIRFTGTETGILSNGASIDRRLDDNEIPHYTLQGVGYLMLGSQPDQKASLVDVNGVSLEANDCTLMYQDLVLPARLSSVSGDCNIKPNRQKFVVLEPGQQLPGKEIQLGNTNALEIYQDAVRLVARDVTTDEIQKNSFLPGFDKIGDYQPIGSATIADGVYQLERNGFNYSVKEYRVPIMAGDKVINTAASPILVAFNSGDKFRLYPQSELTIPFVGIDDVMKPPLLIIKSSDGNNHQENREKGVFVVKGKVRVYVSPQKDHKRVFNLKTANALISVKGTRFEIDDIEETTEVLVVAGVVELRSPSSTEVATVGRGFMSKVVKGSSPTDPTPIPPERFRELLSDPFDSADKPKLVAESDDLNQLEVGPEKPLYFKWNKPVLTSNIVIDGKNYPLEQTDNPDRFVLNRESLKEMVTGKYPVRIEGMDYDGTWGESEAKLSILPGKSLYFLCNDINVPFNKNEIESIKAFQKETQIKVDGIIGPETKQKIREILNCGK